MKLLALIILILFSSSSFAGCFVDLSREDINLSIKHESNNSKNGENHVNLNTVIIETAFQFEGAELETILLTKGDVAEFWLPIAFTKIEHMAVTTITGTESFLKGLEVAFFYEESECTFSLQTLLKTTTSKVN